MQQPQVVDSNVVVGRVMVQYFVPPQLVYGFVPPQIIAYILGDCPLLLTDQELMCRNKILKELRQNLKEAQEQMKYFADCKR